MIPPQKNKNKHGYPRHGPRSRVASPLGLRAISNEHPFVFSVSKGSILPRTARPFLIHKPYVNQHYEEKQNNAATK